MHFNIRKRVIRPAMGVANYSWYIELIDNCGVRLHNEVCYDRDPQPRLSEIADHHINLYIEEVTKWTQAAH